MQAQKKTSEKTQVREAVLKALYEREFNPTPQAIFNGNDKDEGQSLFSADVKNEPDPFSFFSPDLQKHGQELLEGVKNNQTKIDDLIKTTSQAWTIERMSLIDLNIMRIAVYEMLFSDIPFKVCIDEAVKMAKIYGTEHSSKFVNGNLDAIFKNHNQKEISQND